MSETVTAFDLSRLLMNDYPYDFLLEVSARAGITFLVSFIFLRLIGRRGVKQMTSFEIIILLTLGSAAGDVAFYPDVPLFPVMVTFCVIFLIYYLFSVLSQRTCLETLLSGKPKTVIKDGVMVWDIIKRQHIMYRELLMELREEGVDHFGQIRLAILETDGNVSIYFFADEDVKPGLPALPKDLIDSGTCISSTGYHSCTRCSHTDYFSPRPQMTCSVCGHAEWARSCSNTRIK